MKSSMAIVTSFSLSSQVTLSGDYQLLVCYHLNNHHKIPTYEYVSSINAGIRYILV